MSKFLWPADLKYDQKKPTHHQPPKTQLFSCLSGRQKAQRNSTFLESQFLSQNSKHLWPLLPVRLPGGPWRAREDGTDRASAIFCTQQFAPLKPELWTAVLCPGKSLRERESVPTATEVWIYVGDKRTEKDSFRFYYQKCPWGGNHLIRVLLNLGTRLGSSILYPPLDATFLLCLLSLLSSGLAPPKQIQSSSLVWVIPYSVVVSH